MAEARRRGCALVGRRGLVLILSRRCCPLCVSFWVGVLFVLCFGVVGCGMLVDKGEGVRWCDLVAEEEE